MSGACSLCKTSPDFQGPLAPPTGAVAAAPRPMPLAPAPRTVVRDATAAVYCASVSFIVAGSNAGVGWGVTAPTITPQVKSARALAANLAAASWAGDPGSAAMKKAP